MKPLDTQLLDRLSRTHRLFVTIEENVVSGGFGEQVMEYASDAKLPYMCATSACPMTTWSTGMLRSCDGRQGLDCGRIVKQALSDYSEIKG